MEKGTKLAIIFGIALVVGLIIFFASTTIVPTGHIGVVTLYSKVQDNTLDAGFHIVKPFVEEIHDVDIRTQKYADVVEGSAKDLQIVNITMSINYQLKAEKVSELYAKVGKNYTDILLKPAFQSSLKGSIAQFTAEEMITRRGEVASSITEELNKRLEEYCIISAVNLENIGFTEEYNKAIESKTTNEQKALSEKANLEIVKVQNEQKINTAEAEARIMELQNSQITENTLKLKELEVRQKFVEKWSGNLPNTMLSKDIMSIFKVGE